MTETSYLSELLLRWQDLRRQGQEVTVEELCRDCPELAAALRERIKLIAAQDWLNRTSGALTGAERDDQVDTTPGPGLVLAPGAEPLPGYRLTLFQGRGGFGEVWAAETSDRGPVAIKFVRGNLDAPWTKHHAKAELEGLEQIQKVSHPHVLAILETRLIGSTLLIVMELADCTLEQYFRKLPSRCATLNRCILAPDQLRGPARALDHLRENHRLMHLDVKPANLLFVSDVCKLADFGTVKGMRAGKMALGEFRLMPHRRLAGNQARASENSRLHRFLPGREAMRPEATVYTAAGACTFRFASPEMFEGQASASSDQYSLALTFCELVTGRIPFVGKTPAEQLPQRKAGAMDLRLLPESLHPAISRALSPRPEDRFHSCVAFIQALKESFKLTTRASLNWPDRIGLAEEKVWAFPSAPREAVGSARTAGKATKDPIARRGSSGAVRSLTSSQAELDSTLEDKAKPASGLKQRPAKATTWLRRILLIPVRVGDAVPIWIGWLARQVLSLFKAHPWRAQRLEYWLIFVLVVALCWILPHFVSTWVQRLSSLSAAK
jgi:serine/threonine protein kinase